MTRLMPGVAVALAAVDIGSLGGGFGLSDPQAADSIQSGIEGAASAALAMTVQAVSGVFVVVCTHGAFEGVRGEQMVQHGQHVKALVPVRIMALAIAKACQRAAVSRCA